MKRAFAILVAATLSACGSAEAENAVRRQMMDPDATQFRNVEPCVADRTIWHGEFNSKNGFGAYTGFQPFFYENGQVITANGDFEPVLHRCYGKLAESL